MHELEPLIGTWTSEATHPLLPGVVVPGTVTFEWLGDRRFVVERSHNDHPQFPDAIAVLGPPERGDEPVMEYFDERGVRRTYALAVRDGALHLWRDHPGFDQRVALPLGGDVLEATWQLAEEPGAWKDDLHVRWVRVR